MGSTMPEETAFACLDAFCQWGESRGAPVCVDTARVYSSWIPGGDGTSLERTTAAGFPQPATGKRWSFPPRAATGRARAAAAGPGIPA